MQRITELPALPARPTDGHKGTFGRVAIVGGSRGMSGAPTLSGISALRSGAGLVTVCVPQSILPIVAAAEPSLLTKPILEEQGRLASPAIDQLDETISKQNAAAIGPGFGQSDEARKIVLRLFAFADLPVVVDADGLNALAKDRDALSTHAAARVLTPHPGEFARLIDSDVEAVQANREGLASEFAAEHRVILLLKGPQTIVTDGERIAMNTTGNSGMATGGSGDVLTGVIAALLGQGMSPFDAAQLGAHLHGLAGDLAAEELSQQGMIASDLPRFLCRAWQVLSNDRAAAKR